MRTFSTLLILIVFAFGFNNSSGQVRNYTFQDSVGTYTMITGGTQHGSATVDDASFTSIGLGFNFTFNGQTYSYISINSNGYIAFGKNIIETYNPISDPGGTANVVSALAYDIMGQTGASLRSQLLGSSPNRVFVVQWKDFKRYSGGNDSLDFQIRIHETTNIIEIVYGRCTLVSYTNGVDNLFEVGLRGVDNQDFSNRNVSNNNTWNNSITGKTNNATCRITNTIMPSVGLTFYWEKIIYSHDVSVNNIFTTHGCGATTNENISILVKNNGIQTETQIPVMYKINSQTIVIDTISQTLIQNDSTVFTFSQQADLSTYGHYSIIAWTGLASDSFHDNDTLFGYTMFSAPIITQFPYIEGFEQNNANWHAEMITGNNPWEWGIPNQTKISSAHGGQKVWMTGLSSDYLNTSHSYLQSPCFDFTGFSSPRLSFYMRLETETKWDPMVVEASTNEGQSWIRVDSANTNFYNSTNTGGPFVPPYFSGSNSSWSKYTANIGNFGDNNSVTFRFRFLSDGSTTDEGIAIDDIEIYALNDISVQALYMPYDSMCGDSAQEVMLVIKNNGKNNISNTPLQVNITGPINVTLNKTHPTINTGQTDTILIGNFNSNAGGNFQFECYSKLAAEHRRGNDTILKSVYIKKGIPTGGNILPYQPFYGTFNIGTEQNPDIACILDTMTYRFQLPQGYTISGYGLDWLFTEFEFETENGNAPSDTMVIWPGVSDTNFAFRFIPHDQDADSLYRSYLVVSQTNGCNLSYSRFVKVGEKIVSAFSVNDVCSGDSSSFYNQSTVSSGTLDFYWDFGNGDTSSFVNPVILYNQVDSFDVRLIAKAVTGCADTVFDIAVVHETPQAGFSANDNCKNDTVVFLNQTPSLNDTVYFSWDYGNGNISSSYNGLSVFDTGQFTIMLKAVTNNGCVDSLMRMVTIYPIPVASFSVTDICLGDTLFLTNQTLISNQDTLNYFWNFDNQGTSTLENPVFIPGQTGFFNIILNVISNHNCKDSLIDSTEVHPLPDVSFLVHDLCLSDTLFPVNQTTIANQDTLSYLWIFDNQDTSVMMSPFIIPSQADSFIIKLTATSNHGCEESLNKMIQVYNTPIASFSVQNICLGDTLFPDNQSSIVGQDTLSYFWEFGFQDTSTMKNPIIIPTQSGSLNINLTTMSSHNCWDSVSHYSEIYPIPDATFSHSLGSNGIVDFIPGDTMLLSYLWHFGDGDSSTDKSPVHQYHVDNNYLVYLWVKSTFQCENLDSSTINIIGAGIKENDVFNDVKIYPNPFRNMVEIKYSLKKATEVKLTIYDINGRQVIPSIEKQYPAGNIKQSLSLQNLTAGYYILRLGSTNNPVLFYGIIKSE